MVRNHVGKRALVAIAAGLALAGTPAAFALTAAPTVAVAAQEQVRAGQSVTVKHDKDWLGKEKQLNDALDNQSVSEITLGESGDWAPTGTSVFTSRKNVTVDRDLTINGIDDGSTYLHYITFTVTAGHTLTLNNVNVNDSNSLVSDGYHVVTVQNGGTLITKGKGDLIANGGTSSAIAVSVEDGGKAYLGSQASGFMNPLDGNFPAEGGLYGAEVAVEGGANSYIEITAGRYITENYKRPSIDSKGTVKIAPAEDSDLYGNQVGSVRVSGTGSVLEASHVTFGYNEPGPSDISTGDLGYKGTVDLEGGATGYITDSSVHTQNTNYSTPSVYVDADSTLYQQDFGFDLVAPMSTNTDFPAITDLKTYYVGDHLTKNQYYARAILRSEDNAVKGQNVADKTVKRGLYIAKADADTSSLKNQLSAEGTEKLTDGAQDKAGKESDYSGDISTPDTNVAEVSAKIPLGKYQLFAEYEVAHNDDTSIEGDGHVYEVSKPRTVQAGWDVSAYRKGGKLTAPKAGEKATYEIPADDYNDGGTQTVDEAPEGTVFAGWYTAGGDLTTGSATNTPASFKSDVAVPEGNAADNELKADATDGYAYAKFIPEAFLKAGAQKEAVKAGDAYNVRFLSAVDSYNYNKVTYTVQAVDENGKNVGEAQAINATTAFDYLGVTANGQLNKVRAWETYKDADTLYPYTQSNVHAARYFTRGVLKNVKPDFKGSFKVTVSVVTPDGTVVTAPESEFTVDQLSKSVAE